MRTDRKCGQTGNADDRKCGPTEMRTVGNADSRGNADPVEKRSGKADREKRTVELGKTGNADSRDRKCGQSSCGVEEGKSGRKSGPDGKADGKSGQSS